MTITENNPTASAEVSEATEVPTADEFTTRWQNPAGKSWRTWSTRDELIGTVIGGGRGMPVIRLFDHFTGRSVGFSGSVTLFEHETIKVLAQNPATCEPYFSRYANFDALYVQYSGVSVIDTEYGPLRVEPFQVAHIPAGVAHRSIGDPDCQRLLVLSREPVDVAITPESYTTDRHFVVRPNGGLSGGGAVEPVLPAPDNGWDYEAAFLWDEPFYKPTWYKRKIDALASGTSGGREPVVIRIFDVFAHMTGKSRGGPGPKIFSNSELEMKVYNTEGHQYGFHRGNGQDELWMQFRAESLNETEYGVVPLGAGQATIAPPGISHRILGREGFLRFNLYSRRPLTLRVDPLQAITSTKFEISE
jgi:hypothetical protein